MSNGFDEYQRRKSTEAERFHEAGHGAVARIRDSAITVKAELTGEGAGNATITFPAAIPIGTKYEVAISGCMAEAKKVSDLNIDVDEQRMSEFAAAVVALLQIGETPFEVDVPVHGDQNQPAACNTEDFGWLGGEPVSLPVLTEAVRSVGVLLNNEQNWNEVETIAEILFQKDEYDSETDTYWEDEDE